MAVSYTHLDVYKRQEYILVTAGAQGDHHTDPYHIEDALLLYGRLPGVGKA